MKSRCGLRAAVVYSSQIRMEHTRKDPLVGEASSAVDAAFSARWAEYLERWLLDDSTYGRPYLRPSEITYLDQFLSTGRPIKTDLLRREVRAALCDAFVRISRVGRHQEDGFATAYGCYRQAQRHFADQTALQEIRYLLNIDPETDAQETKDALFPNSTTPETEGDCVHWFYVLWTRRAERFLQRHLHRDELPSALNALKEGRPLDIDIDHDAMLTEIFSYTIEQTFAGRPKHHPTDMEGLKNALEARVLWRIPEVFPQNAKTNRAALLRALQAMEGDEKSFEFQRLMHQGGPGESGEAIFQAIDEGRPPAGGSSKEYYLLNRYGTHRYFINAKTFEVYYSVGHGKLNAERAKRHGFLLSY